MMQQHITGSASELFAAYKFTENGHTVFFPAMTQSKADFVADVDGKLLRVQVKSGTEIHNGRYIQVRLGGCGRAEYTADNMDLLAIVWKGRLWVIPEEIVRGKTSLSFNPIESERKKRNDFIQYEW